MRPMTCCSPPGGGAGRDARPPLQSRGRVPKPSSLCGRCWIRPVRSIRSWNKCSGTRGGFGADHLSLNRIVNPLGCLYIELCRVTGRREMAGAAGIWRLRFSNGRVDMNGTMGALGVEQFIDLGPGAELVEGCGGGAGGRTRRCRGRLAGRPKRKRRSGWRGGGGGGFEINWSLARFFKGCGGRLTGMGRRRRGRVTRRRR